VEGFDCGSFYMAGDNRSLYANMEENTNELLVSSTSFNRFNWECTSCEVRHDLLPLRHERYEWEGGRKLFIISDQNMPPMLPSKKGMCPAVLRIDGGHLRELGTTFLTILGRYAVPEGSVIMIGSLSHLMEEGRVGYAKALVTEQIRFCKAFKNTVHVVPFVPPPLCGTNDPELMRAILDVAGWLEKAQKWKLPDYYADLRLHVITGGEGEDQQQFTTRQKLPKSLDAYNDRVYMCHPWDGLQTSLPPMAENTERELITSLLLNIGECFKWSLDPEPALTREFRQLPANSARAGQGAAALIIGGSNANRLTTAFTDLGKRVETISAGGWMVSRDSVDTLLPILRAKIDLLDPEAPVILWCMDSHFFRQLTASGDLAGITRGEDGRFHVTGQLMVTPFSLLRDMLSELNRIVAACGTHPVMILEAVPRFLIRSCCMDMLHCANIRGADSASIAACKKVMEDLSSLNTRVGEYLQTEQVKMVKTGDLLTGRADSPVAVYMDTLYEIWGSDTVHGDKIAYSKLAIGLLDNLNRTLPDSDLRHNIQSRKRSLDSSPDILYRREDSNRRFSDRQGGNSAGGSYSGGASRSDMEPRRFSAYQSNRDESFQSNRDSSAFSTYPGSSREPRRFGGRGGGRRLDY
jgi:hypothetical protein